MFGNVALYRKHALFGVKPDCKEQRHKVVGSSAKVGGQVRHRKAVQIRHHINTVVFVLHFHHIS